MRKRAQVVDLPQDLVSKIDLTRPVADQIASTLRTAILDMTLHPGQIISEAELGNTFGASRTPVREAIALLRDQGLIVTLPSRGNFVSKLSISEIKGAQFVRQSLEESVADHHCEKGLQTHTIAQLVKNLEDQSKCVNTGDGRAFHQLDDAFHMTLASAVGHPRIPTTIEREKARLDRLRVLSLNSRQNLETLVMDHTEILKAIRAQDHARARSCVQLHLRRVLDTLSDVQSEHLDYFDNE